MVEQTATQESQPSTRGAPPPGSSMSTMPTPPTDYAQLTQLTVPLADAQLAFGTPDATGRLPIILLPTAPFRVNTTLVLIGAIALVAGVILSVALAARAVGIAAGLVLIVVGVLPAFFVRIPEGSNAILLQRGRFLKTLGPGNHRLMPWIAVSHLVTSREIPFDIPCASVPNAEGVRVSLDILLTFRVVHPEKFVFAISAPDFDQVCQASGQDALRRLVRTTTTDGVLDLDEHACQALAANIDGALEPYGVSVKKAVLTYVRLPDDVMRSLEARRLATVQLSEESEVQALRVQRDANAHALDQQQVAARRRVFEIEADNETFRLAQLERRLQEYPAATRWDFERQRLDVARALAGNTKAIVQMSAGTDVATSLLMHEAPAEAAGVDASPAHVVVQPGEPGAGPTHKRAR